MAARLAALLPRFIALTAIFIFATATLTFAAEKRMLSSAPKPAAPAPAAVLTVPDVEGQAYVFAKSTLEEAGFAWRVTGPVQGYSANVVAAQSPAEETRVLDTGAPTILLGLSRNSRYAQDGAPENASPYPGTAVRLPVAPARPKPARPAPRKPAMPKRKPPVAKPVKRKQARPPAFAARGAPREPQDEISLPARARRLAAWLEQHPAPTDANVGHWLYQHEWIVTGARFGWWRGAEALRLLIRVDRRAQALWGIGARSEAVARRALAQVRARSR